MKAYTLCLLALAAFSSARPNPPGQGGGYPGQGRGGYHPSKLQNPEYYKNAKHTSSVGGGEYEEEGRGGSPATTAFPTMNSVAGGYGGAGTAGYAGAGAGGYQPPAPTSSAVKKTSYQETTEYSEKSGQTPDEPNPGNSGSQSLGSSPSSVAGSGPVSTGTSSTGNTTTGATLSSGKITLPAGCQSVNNIGFGWLPDYNGASLAADESAVGNKNPCFAGYYGQTGLSGWNDGAQITDNIAVSVIVLTVCEVLADTLARTLNPAVNLIRSSLLRSCHKVLLLINLRRVRTSSIPLQVP